MSVAFALIVKEPAAGSAKRHAAEQSELLRTALTLD